jgi:hypothetical protein
LIIITVRIDLKIKLLPFKAEISHWWQRAKNADLLFSKARITEDARHESVENAEHDIARLQTRIAQYHETEMSLKLTTEMVENLVHNWNQANAEMRRALASSIFEYLVYDLDARQIVDFKLKPWAELLMQLKLTLDDDGDDKKCPLHLVGNRVYSGVPGGRRAHNRIIAIHRSCHAHDSSPRLWRQSRRITDAGKTTAQCRNLSPLSGW